MSEELPDHLRLYFNQASPTSPRRLFSNRTDYLKLDNQFYDSIVMRLLPFGFEKNYNSLEDAFDFKDLADMELSNMPMDGWWLSAVDAVRISDLGYWKKYVVYYRFTDEEDAIRCKLIVG